MPSPLRQVHIQFGVCIPTDTRSTPVMIISELCPNGDLFDYIRNVPPPPLRKVVSSYIPEIPLA